jgi:phage-related minor tail protein
MVVKNKAEGKTTITRPVAIAFVALIDAVKSGNTVLLLRDNDVCALNAVQEYNDHLQDLPANELSSASRTFAKFSNVIAERFSERASAATGHPVMYSDDVLKEAAEIIASIFKSGRTEGWPC